MTPIDVKDVYHVMQPDDTSWLFLLLLWFYGWQCYELYDKGKYLWLSKNYICEYYIDTRTGTCYTDSRCSSTSAMDGVSTLGQCCCSNGAAWGARCEACPRPGTGKMSS